MIENPKPGCQAGTIETDVGFSGHVGVKNAVMTAICGERQASYEYYVGYDNDEARAAGRDQLPQFISGLCIGCPNFDEPNPVVPESHDSDSGTWRPH